MVQGGPRWVPPSMTAAEATVPTGRAGERPLSDRELGRWEDLLRGLTAERSSICEVRGVVIGGLVARLFEEGWWAHRVVTAPINVCT